MTVGALKIAHAHSPAPAPSIEALVARHERSLRAYLAALGCAPDRADDLLQDVFLSALSRGLADRGEQATAVWMRKAARHLYLRGLDRERRGAELAELAAAEEAWEEFDAGDGGQRYLGALRACMEGVQPRARQALDLYYRERLPREGVGERLGLSLSGVNSLLVRTRRALRECIERRLAG